MIEYLLILLPGLVCFALTFTITWILLESRRRP